MPSLPGSLPSLLLILCARQGRTGPQRRIHRGGIRRVRCPDMFQASPPGWLLPSYDRTRFTSDNLTHPALEASLQCWGPARFGPFERTSGHDRL